MNVCPIKFQFPPEFDTGDAHKVKMRLPNHVYNKLKIHSMKENKRANKLHEKKEHSTAVRNLPLINFSKDTNGNE